MWNERFLKQMTDLIFVQDDPEKADMIFVPGSGFPQIAEKAAELYKAGYAPFVLPSGRYSILLGHFAGVMDKKEIYDGEYETEWEFLKEVLLQNGVDEAHILREDQASYTYENAIYSRKVTDEAGLEIRTAIICCKPAHARRSLLYYQLLYPETEFLICPADHCEITRDNWYLTEEGCENVLGEISRCGGQFHEIMREMRK